MVMKHKPKCENDDITTIETSSESHSYWKKHFHKNPSYFKIFADFQADNEKDNSIVGNKTTNIYKQNPVPNRYHVETELNDILKSGYYKSPLGYNKRVFSKGHSTNYSYILYTITEVIHDTIPS